MQLIVYTAEWCHNCKSVKRFLDERGVEYETVDVDNERGAGLARKKGITGLPYLEATSTTGRERSGVGSQMLSGLEEFLKT